MVGEGEGGLVGGGEGVLLVDFAFEGGALGCGAGFLGDGVVD